MDSPSFSTSTTHEALISEDFPSVDYENAPPEAILSQEQVQDASTAIIEGETEVEEEEIEEELIIEDFTIDGICGVY